METTQKSKLAYQRDEYSVHRIVYHLIWCPKRQKPILTGSLQNRCQELLEAKCHKKGWDRLTLALQPDHSHRFVRVWPSARAAEVVKAFQLLLSKLSSQWTRSYFASTAGALSAQTSQDSLDAKTGG